MSINVLIKITYLGVCGLSLYQINQENNAYQYY